MSDSMRAAVYQAAANLLASPSDLGAWVDLGDALHGAGRKGQAATSFQALGEAASALGSVALAAACARWLHGHGLSRGGDAVIATIARTHCQGSKAVRTALHNVPPLAPPPSEDETLTGTMIDDLDDAVDRAMAAAIGAARQRAPKVLPPTPLVRALEPDEFRELVAVMELRRVKPGEIVLEVGDPAVALYWIARGSVEVRRGEHRLGEVFANAFFGEIALLGGTRRTARVVAREVTWLIEVPAEALERAAVKAPRLAQVLAAHARARLLANVMRTSELFARLVEEERAELLPKFEAELFEAGQRIVAAGADNDRLYVVASGRCEVRRDGAVVAELQVGDGIGEISLLQRTPATADVVATERVVVLTLSRATFDQIAVKHPALLAEVYRLLVERQRAHEAIVHDASDLVI